MKFKKLSVTALIAALTLTNVCTAYTAPTAEDAEFNIYDEAE